MFQGQQVHNSFAASKAVRNQPAGYQWEDASRDITCHQDAAGVDIVAVPRAQEKTVLLDISEAHKSLNRHCSCSKFCNACQTEPRQTRLLDKDGHLFECP